MQQDVASLDVHPDTVVNLIKKGWMFYFFWHPTQKHPFFRHVCWDDLLNKRVEPPYKPQLVGRRVTSTPTVLLSTPSPATLHPVGAFSPPLVSSLTILVSSQTIPPKGSLAWKQSGLYDSSVLFCLACSSRRKMWASLTPDSPYRPQWTVQTIPRSVTVQNSPLRWDLPPFWVFCPVRLTKQCAS